MDEFKFISWLTDLFAIRLVFAVQWCLDYQEFKARSTHLYVCKFWLMWPDIHDPVLRWNFNLSLIWFRRPELRNRPVQSPLTPRKLVDLFTNKYRFLSVLWQRLPVRVITVAIRQSSGQVSAFNGLSGVLFNRTSICRNFGFSAACWLNIGSSVAG